MLKRFFISMLGSLAAIWISFMLLIILGMVTMIGSLAGSIANSGTKAELADFTVLHINLDSEIVEKNQYDEFYTLLSQKSSTLALDELLSAIRTAKTDDKIEGIFLNCNGSTAGAATRLAILNALKDFRISGKWVVAYGDSYSQGDYYIASCADHILLNPVGMVDIHGVGTMTPFFKGVLDKIGVEMQIIKVGTYKSAVEPFILTSMSEPSREQTSVYVNAIWKNVCKAIAKNRDITPEELNSIADSLSIAIPAEKLVELKIVDQLKYRHEAIDHIKQLAGKSHDDDLNILTPSEYLSIAEPINSKGNKNKIAVYYAFGEITDNGSEGIVASKMVPEILDLADDDDISAMVLRVNSPGGSAFASEQIWEALEVFKSKDKKLYVSMGDYAASGGYYISCGADKIFAEPVTLTGSIGIYGMIPCAKELITDKIGVTFSTVATNPNALFPTLVEPMTPLQREAMQREINRGYDLFTSRCAEGRHISQDSIKVIGEGRVWDGRTAMNIGLVDKMGGLNDAIKALASDLGYEKYQVIEYPNDKKSIFDFFTDYQNIIKASALKTELGSFYPVYQELKQLSTASPVQAKMEQVIVE